MCIKSVICDYCTLGSFSALLMISMKVLWMTSQQSSKLGLKLMLDSFTCSLTSSTWDWTYFISSNISPMSLPSWQTQNTMREINNSRIRKCNKKKQQQKKTLKPYAEWRNTAGPVRSLWPGFEAAMTWEQPHSWRTPGQQLEQPSHSWV